MAQPQLPRACTAVTEGRPAVRVPERGNVALDSERWEVLRCAPEFWKLVEAKIVGVEQHGHDSVRLLGKAHVGRAYAGGLLLEVHEKVQGATAALMASTTPRLRNQHIDSPTTELGRLVTVLVQAFVDEVRNYAGSGREWRYDEEDEVGSTIAGRLDVRRTVALRARGQRHLVAFRRSTVSRATPLNRVVLAALREVEILSDLQRLRTSDIAGARGLAVLFEDCLDVEVLARSPALSVEAAELAETAVPDRKDLLSLAALLLSHQSLQPEQPLTGNAPLAWFVNLETLFERVVLSSIRAAVPRGTSVSKGAARGQAVFPDEALLVADPDIVVGKRPASAVGDVKYKTWEGTAAASDLYQLLVHSATFGSTDAFLVYPSDRFEEVNLGTSSTGCGTRLFALDVRNVPRDVRRLPGVVSAAAASATMSRESLPVKALTQIETG